MPEMTAAEQAAWEVAKNRGLTISRNDLRLLLEAASAYTYTKEAVSSALNWAADEAQEIINPDDMESSDTIAGDDVVNLVVNLAGERLDGAETAADAIGSAYGGEDIQEWHGWTVKDWPENGEDFGEDIITDD